MRRPLPPIPDNRAAQLAPAQSGGERYFRSGFRASSQPGTTTAFDANQRALIDRVNVYLMSVQTLVGDFVQVGPDGRRSDGKIYLQKPGRVRFEYNPPSPIELVADGNSLVVRDRKLETQDLYPLSQTPLRFLLADRIDLLRETNVVSVSADDTFVSLLIEEKQTLGGTPQGAADVLREGHAAQAVDHHRPAGLRHHGRALQSRLVEEARSVDVPDQLRAHKRSFSAPPHTVISPFTRRSFCFSARIAFPQTRGTRAAAETLPLARHL